MMKCAGGEKVDGYIRLEVFDFRYYSEEPIIDGERIMGGGGGWEVVFGVGDLLLLVVLDCGI